MTIEAIVERLDKAIADGWIDPYDLFYLKDEWLEFRWCYSPEDQYQLDSRFEQLEQISPLED